jgi:hypothetical protein
MSAEDADWAAELMERKRQEYGRYSPVFWRPARNVTGRHARYLRGLIGAPTTIALRTRDGFIICQRRETEGFVDDFTVTPPGTWDSTGAELLLAAAERLAASGVGSVLVVTAHADEAKCGMLASLSLRVREQWWVRELSPARPAAAVPGQVSGPGFAGFLGPAPPVYDPGGLVFQAAGQADPVVTEHAATERGAVLAVIPAVPGSAAADQLHRAGWSVAPDWYAGWPARSYAPRSGMVG